MVFNYVVYILQFHGWAGFPFHGIIEKNHGEDVCLSRGVMLLDIAK